jgi:hypothetical protein
MGAGLHKLFNHIREEYLLIADKLGAEDPDIVVNNPHKISIPLEYDEYALSMTSFFNVLACRHSSGHFGSKSIMCDMAARKTDSITTLFGPDNGFVGTFDSKKATDTRSALMALLAVDQFYAAGGDFDYLRKLNLSFGFIGTGAMNQEAARVLCEFLGEPVIYARGSPTNPEKNMNKLPNHSNFGSIDEVMSCNVVFVATTETTAPGQLQIEIEADSDDSPDLLITQDTGCLLGESFRATYPSFSDDPGSLAAHFEDCFPWDEDDDVEIADMTALEEADNACVYLYGMAFCDIIMAMDEYGKLNETG